MLKKQTSSLPLTTQFWLTRPWRISLMITLILAFFILAPAIVLYTIGWRYDWSTNRLRGTGVISVHVNPPQAKTYINDLLVGERQPLRLASRAPGLYHLRVEAPGYRPWLQDITVSEHQTTFVREVELYRQAEPTLAYEKKPNILAAYPGTKSDYILSIEATKTGYQVGYLNDQDTIVITTSTATFRPQIYPAPDRLSAVVITQDSTNGYRLTLARLNTPDTRLITWQTSTPSWQWDSENNQNIFLKKDDKLFIQNFTPALDRIITTNTNTIWYYSTNQQIWSAHQTSLFRDNQFIIELSEPITAILAVNANRVLVTHASSITAIQLDSQGLAINQTSRELPNVRYAPELDEWLAWSAWELWDFYADGSSALLLRSQEPIQDVYALPRMGTLAIAYPTGIDAFNPGYFVTDRLVNLETVEHLEVNERERILYAVGRYRSGQPGLYKLEY